jgi:hypothetical protein
MKRHSIVSAAALVLLMAGCSSSGSSSDDDAGTLPPPPDAPPLAGASTGGVWHGELEVTGGGTLAIRGMVTESGEFRVLDLDLGQQVFGAFEVDAQLVSAADAVWALPWGSSTPAGSRHGFTEISGLIEPRVSLTGLFTTTGEEGDEFFGSFSLHYDDVYERGSSLATLAGTYTTATESLAIDAQGDMFYQSSANDCAASGSARVIDADFNLYRMEFDAVQGCTGDASVRNGLSFTGLAYLKDDTVVSNGTLEFAVSGESADSFVIWTLEAQK